MDYKAPLKDMLFTLQHVADIDDITRLPGLEEAGLDTASAVLDECAKFNQEVMSPLNRAGDLQPAVCKDGVVTTSPGFAQAHKAFAQGGWQGVGHPESFGGAGLPKLISTPCLEMLNSANLAFALCPLLSDGAVDALLTAGSDELQQVFVEKMVSGEWTGTMNLTEAQAGSDLSLVRSKAEPQPDGSYRVSGQKIFITFGEHDMTDNIVHMVLARTPGSPEGVKGISLFVVPKFLVNDDGTLGQRNDVYCASIEHKLGIHGSPTAVLIFGDDKGDVGPGAIGYLVGDENRGLEYMFVMMNTARFAVGLQGIAVAERSYQHAVGYAKERLQSRDVQGSSGPVSIIRHPDVRRMLMRMRSQTQAARSLAYYAAGLKDSANHHPDTAVRKEHKSLYEFLVPLVKGYSTEMSLDVTSQGVQVHGGMGFIEETGAAQYYRDARILPIYEGTTAIQANDFIGRKTSRDGGITAGLLLARIEHTVEQLNTSDAADLRAIGARLNVAANDFRESVAFIVSSSSANVSAAFAGSVPYLMLGGTVVGGWLLGKAALAAQAQLENGDADNEFLSAKIATARFFADHHLTQATGLAASITDGSVGTLAMSEAQF